MGYEPDIVIYPGETLLETLEELGMSQAELSARTGITTKTINEIVKGKNPITSETALKLERVLGVPASFWNNLEKNFQETRSRLLSQEALRKEDEISKKFTCYNELVKLGFVQKTQKRRDRTINLLDFFRVHSLSFVPKIEEVAFRKSHGNYSKESLAAWLRCGELCSEKLELKRFDKIKLKGSIDEFRKLTINPADFSKILQELCADCGVAVVYVPYFKNTKINGATRWKKGYPLIQLNIRWKYSDIFWFTFFHELGHVILHGKREQFLNFDNGILDKKEMEANKFASNTLISSSKYRQFITKDNFSIQSIKRFSQAIGVDPGITAGRLAHDNKVHWSQIECLRTKFIY